jgi:hypothetical protein
MKQILSHLTYIFLGATLLSCEKNVTIDIPSSSPKLVVNCGITTDSSWSIFVGRTVPLFDEHTPKYINGANISLSADDGTLIPLANTGNGIYTSAQKPLLGKEYRVEVNVEGFPGVSATCRPLTPPQVELVSKTIKFENGYSSTSVEVRLTDSKDSEDFYIIEARSPESLIDLNTTYIAYYNLGCDDLACENVGTDETSKQLLFRDRIFSGSKKIIVFTIEGVDYQNTEVECVIKRCSYDFGEYKRTLFLHQSNLDSPFSQPVKIYTNVNNGLGIFASYQSTVIPLY